jgi:hypothetical protein
VEQGSEANQGRGTRGRPVRGGGEQQQRRDEEEDDAAAAWRGERPPRRWHADGSMQRRPSEMSRTERSVRTRRGVDGGLEEARWAFKVGNRLLSGPCYKQSNLLGWAFSYE